MIFKEKIGAEHGHAGQREPQAPAQVGRFMFVTGRRGTFLARTEAWTALLMSPPP